MPADAIHARTPVETAAQEVLVVNLRNAHAVERQVIAVLEGQLPLLDDYPDLHARLTRHVAETRDQVLRLETALENCGSSPSGFKDALLSAMGMGQSSMQGFAEDAVLKAVVADTMTAHLEIATYRTLLVLAGLAGQAGLQAALMQSLREEEAMAEWFDQNLEPITQRFVELKARADAGDRARTGKPSASTG